VSCGDIFGVDADAVVSPANSFGFMDGGVDRVYLDRLGWDLQDRLQQLLRERHDGELPVGQAVVLETLCPSPRYLVSAPTMRLPGPVPQTLHAYLAFRAALQAVRALDAARPGAVGSLVCPGMATARGQMPVDRCARQMRAAYDNVVRGVQPGADAGGVNRILRQHMLMLR
jgi:O-acetyl-ADP-ribose deacetylase (regulator of RNase III)